MFKNFFVLKRLVNELNDSFKDSFVNDIFSQERQKLVFSLSNDESNSFLEISASSQDSYIILRSRYSRAKKNTMNFFNSLLQSKIKGFSIAESDRVIRIETTSGNLYFNIKGPKTNIYCLNNGEISSFKKDTLIESETFLNEIKDLDFNNKLDNPRFEFPNGFSNTYIKTNYPQINKELIKEYIFRKEISPDTSDERIFRDIVQEIYTNNFTIFADIDNNKHFLAPSSFKQYQNLNKKDFTSVNEAIYTFIIDKRIHLDSELNKKVVEKFLSTELEKTSYKINNLKIRIAKGSNEEIYNKSGNLLLINLLNIQKGSKSIVVSDIYSENEKFEIALNEKLGPKENINYYFEKSRSEKINFEKSKLLYKELLNKYDKFQLSKEKLNLAKDNIDIKKLKMELKIKEENFKNENDNISTKFKHYIIEDKYDLYVGKDSTNNDLLTVKFAKQNDYWFHARSLPGSHVVLRVNNTKEPVPKNILKKAASIAAYHSKAKTAGVVPVSFTLKKYVVKKKGMTAGKVALLKEDVLLVKPEIPAGCIYLSSELE